MVGKAIEFLGLTGDFPQIESGVLLRIYLHGGEIDKWATIVEEVIELGTAQHKSLEKLIGGLSFTHTSIIGRFGRSMIKPL